MYPVVAGRRTSLLIKRSIFAFTRVLFYGDWMEPRPIWENICGRCKSWPGVLYENMQKSSWNLWFFCAKSVGTPALIIGGPRLHRHLCDLHLDAWKLKEIPGIAENTQYSCIIEGQLKILLIKYIAGRLVINNWMRNGSRSQSDWYTYSSRLCSN